MTWNEEFAYPMPAPPGILGKNHPTTPETLIWRRPILLEGDRPAVIEDWIEPDMHLYCRTAWYSVLDIEEWSEGEHYDYLAANSIVEKDPELGRNVGSKKVEDEEGNIIWSVTVVIDEIG